MAPARKAPASVRTAVALAIILALLFGGLVSVFGFVDGQQDLAIGGIVIGALLLALAWRLWKGGRGALILVLTLPSSARTYFGSPHEGRPHMTGAHG